MSDTVLPCAICGATPMMVLGGVGAGNWLVCQNSPSHYRGLRMERPTLIEAKAAWNDQQVVTAQIKGEAEAAVRGLGFDLLDEYFVAKQDEEMRRLQREIWRADAERAARERDERIQRRAAEREAIDRAGRALAEAARPRPTVSTRPRYRAEPEAGYRHRQKDDAALRRMARDQEEWAVSISEGWEPPRGWLAEAFGDGDWSGLVVVS